MKIVFIFVAIVALVGAQNIVEVQEEQSPDPSAVEPSPTIDDVGSELITSLISSDFFQNKIQRFYQFLDLKVRFVKLVKTFLTRPNLLFLRSILDFVMRWCNFAISFLPEPETEARGSTFFGSLDSIFPSVSLNNPENPVNMQRINRQVNFSNEDKDLFEKHKDDVLDVARLIYSTP